MSAKVKKKAIGAKAFGSVNPILYPITSTDVFHVPESSAMPLLY